MYVLRVGGAKDGEEDILVVGIIIGKSGVADRLKLRKNGWNGLLPQRTEMNDMFALCGRQVNTTRIGSIILQWSNIYVIGHERIRLPTQETCGIIDTTLLFVEHGNYIL